MPLFKSKPKPVEGLDDLPTEEDVGKITEDEAGSLEDNPASSQDDIGRGIRQKVGTSKDKTNRSFSTRLQEAEQRRTRMKLARQLSNQSMEDEDSIETLLGVDPKGCCLRHPMFLIRTGEVVKPNRLETILDCKLCRQDSVQSRPKGYHRESTVDPTGQVKQLTKNKKGWKDQLHQGSYQSEEGDVDGKWKEQASLRLDQVLIWDIDKAPLKCNPQYAKYFRMIKDGADIEAVKQICEMEDMDPRTLDFDPDLPLSEQLESANWLSQAAQDEIRYSASGKGATPEGLDEAVNSLHDAYIQCTGLPLDPAPNFLESPMKSLRKSLSTGFNQMKENIERVSPMKQPVTATPIKRATPVVKDGGTPIIATPVQAIPVRSKKKQKGRFGFGGGRSSSPAPPTTAPTKIAKPKLAKMDSKEIRRELEMQEIRKMQKDQREERERQREKKKVSKLTGMMLGNENRTLKLQRATEELEDTKELLLNTRLKVDEKNAEGTELIAQIQMLQIRLDAVNQRHDALSTRIQEIQQERGISERSDPEVDATSATGSYDGFEGDGYARKNSDRSLLSVPEPEPLGRLVSIGDKERADENDTPRTKRRKSQRSRRRGRKSALSKASTRREPNFDREFLIEKFQESIRKLITINRFFQMANDQAMSKENDVDQKSFGMRKSVLTDLIMPDFDQFDDEEWEYYDVEIDEDDEIGDEDTVEDSLGPLPTFGRNSLQSLPMFSPSVNHARKSMIVKKSPTSEPPLPPPPVNDNSKVRWNDAKLFTVRVVPRVPTDLFYTMDEIKMFRFEKFMDDNADEFEVVDDEEWEEEEIIEDDDFSYESYDDESYYSEEEVTVNTGGPRVSDSTFGSKGWTYDESAFLREEEPPPPAPATNENETKPAATTSADNQATKDDTADSIFRERSPNTTAGMEAISKTSSAAGNILDDLSGQVDAIIKRKATDKELMAFMPKEGEASSASRGLPESNADGDQDEQDEDPATQPSEPLTSITEDQILELRRTFHAFDTNGSGYIEHDELKVNLKTVGYNINEEGIDNLLATVGSKDNRLNFEEFIAWNRVLWKDDMKDKFKAIDSQNRGYIDKGQLKAYVVDLGHGFNDEELDELCYEMDPKGDDKIQLDDFINVMASSRAGNSYCVVNGELYIEKLKTDFRSMDVDNSGFVTRDNLQEMAQKSDYILSEKELDETMKELDLDGNGEISIDEFIAASVRIKVPSAEKKETTKDPSDRKDFDRTSSVSLLEPGKPLETLVETPQERRETEAEKYHKRLAALADKDKPAETGQDFESPKTSSKSSVAGNSGGGNLDAPPPAVTHDAETPKTSSKSSITNGSDGGSLEGPPLVNSANMDPEDLLQGLESKDDSDANTETSVPGDVPEKKANERPSNLSNFLGRSSTHSIPEGSTTELSFVDQQRTSQFNKSNEVSMSELSALTTDILGGSERSSKVLSPRTSETPAPPGPLAERVSSLTVDPAIRISQLETEEAAAAAAPGKLDLNAFQAVVASAPTSSPDNEPGKLDLTKFQAAPAPAPEATTPAPGKIDMKQFEPAPAPAPTPAPVPNAFQKKPQFLRSNSNSKLKNKNKNPSLKRESTIGSKTSKSSVSYLSSGDEDWSSEEEEEGGTPRNNSKTNVKNNNNASSEDSSLPLISLGDKMEADKEAGVPVVGPDGSPKKRRRRRRSNKSNKPKREPNLDPTFLRNTFKQRIRKLIALNRFFQQATDAMFDKEMGNDRKSFGVGGNGLSLLTKMSVSDITELEEMFDSDESEEETDGVGSLVSFRETLQKIPAGSGLDRQASARSMVSTTSFAPPDLTVQPKRSAVNTAARKASRAKVNVSFRPEKKMHKVKLIPFLTEEQTKEFFWSGEELKLFRFEKFMEDNANEFELVDDDEIEEVEYEEEEYEEISWVSGDEYDEVSYDEETIGDSIVG